MHIEVEGGTRKRKRENIAISPIALLHIVKGDSPRKSCVSSRVRQWKKKRLLLQLLS